MPHRNRLMWRCKAGQFESIRWAGSPLDDPFGLSPWWAGGVITTLLSEMPQEYNEHLGPSIEVNRVVNLMVGDEKPQHCPPL
ncbi:hypothetical protein BT69DRAFT_1285233 [Atractiella rhizophila]|nr:hypothetical protein BT69DRAFT_1285233 [Atractiella rhizophila]